jgi:hypothetical protein
VARLDVAGPSVLGVLRELTRETAHPETHQTPETYLSSGFSLVAGARNHLQANRSLAFRFGVTA